jgi:serine/threonine-protein kinase HipA
LGITTALSALVQVGDGSLAYVTRRFDRTTPRGKLHVEDFAQLLGKSMPGDEKFDGSVGDIATALARLASVRARRSSQERLVALTLFNFLFGNGDAHLKNHSLVGLPSGSSRQAFYTLAPAYDLLPTSFLGRRNRDDTALTINGKRRNLTKKDFAAEASRCAVSPEKVGKAYERFSTGLLSIDRDLSTSFIPPGTAIELRKRIADRFKRLGSS